jgi:hypothetical protein
MDIFQVWTDLPAVVMRGLLGAIVDDDGAPRAAVIIAALFTSFRQRPGLCEVTGNKPALHWF